MSKSFSFKNFTIFEKLEVHDEFEKLNQNDKKIKFLEMLGKHEFINKYIDLNDFENKNELYLKIENLLPKYEEYIMSKQVFQKKKNEYFNMKKLKTLTLKGIPTSQSEVISKSSSPSIKIINEHIVNNKNSSLEDLSNNLKTSFNKLISDKVVFNQKKNKNKKTKKSPKTDQTPLKNNSIYQNLIYKSNYMNFFKKFFPSVGDPNIFKNVQDFGKIVYNINPPKEIEAYKHIEEVAKNSIYSNHSLPSLTTCRTTFLSTFNNCITKKKNSHGSLESPRRSNEKNNYKITSKLPFNTLETKINECKSDILLKTKYLKTDEQKNSINIHTNINFNNSIRKDYTKLVTYGCTNALKNTKTELTKNQKIINTNHSKTMLIFNKHISDKKYIHNDKDMILIKRFAKKDLIKPNAFIYGKIRGHQLINNKKIFFMDLKQDKEII